MNADQSRTVGIVLIFALFFLWLQLVAPSEEKQKELNKEQTNQEKQKETSKVEELVNAYAQKGEQKKIEKGERYSLSNPLATFSFTTLGAQPCSAHMDRIFDQKGKKVQLLHPHHLLSFSFTLEDGTITTTHTLLFKLETQEEGLLSFLYTDPSDHKKWIRLTYTLKKDAHCFTCDMALGEGWKLKQDGTHEQNFFIKHINTEGKITYDAKSQIQAHIGNEKKEEKIFPQPKKTLALKEHGWASSQQPFFTIGLCSEGEKKVACIGAKEEEKEQVLSQSLIKVVYTAEQLQQGVKTTFYIGPTKYNELKKVGYGFEKNKYYGWKIFGVANKWIFSPIAEAMSGYHFILTLFVLVILVSLVQGYAFYYSHRHRIKLEALKPYLEEIKRRNPDDSSRQMEEMNFQRKAGVNAFLPFLLQLMNLPILIALRTFTQGNFYARNVSFLWIKSLSNCDDFIPLPFRIPYIGTHISLLGVIITAIIIVTQHFHSTPIASTNKKQTKMSTYMSYFMPFIFFFLFNSASAAFWVYRLFNALITLVIQLLFKLYIDADKIKKEVIKKAEAVESAPSLPRAHLRAQKRNQRR